MKFEQPDPTKLRNSALIIGVVLLAISAAGIQINLEEPVSFLGLPLTLENSNLITYALMGVSAYFVFRYWYYGMRRRSTWEIRDLILDEFEEVPELNKHKATMATHEIVKFWFECIDHAGLRYDDRKSFQAPEPDNPNRTYWLIEVTNLRKYSFATFLRDVDFVAPVIVNVLALGFAIWNVVS